MEWTQLRRLDIGLSCPQHFFEQIGGHLLSLRSLTMGIRTGNRRYQHWVQGPLTCTDIWSVSRIVKSLPALHELRVTDFESAAFIMAPAILDSQQALHSLSYLSSMYRRERRNNQDYVWSTALLLMLYQQSPTLTHLELDFVLEGKWVSKTTLLIFG